MNKSHLLGAVCAFVLSATFGISAHSSVIDQQNISPINNGFCGGNCIWQQEVVAGMNGFLTGLDVYVYTSGSTNGALDIWLGSPLQTDLPDFSAAFTATASGANYIDLSAAAISLNTNDAFTFALVVFGPSAGPQGMWVDVAGGGYSAGDLHLITPSSDGSSCFEDCKYDLAFTSYMSAVPIPPALWLFGSGLLGLIGIARRKKA